jgi:hypothetical protein
MQHAASQPNLKMANHASSMIVEDHMKKLLSMTSGKKWKFSNNKMLPKSQHSPFGDYPADYMRNVNKSTLQPVPKIAGAEVSMAMCHSKCSL